MLQGYKLSNIDRTEVFLVRPASVIVLRLSPYTGWEDLFARAQRDWGIARGAARPGALSRLGVRYINRIDVPFSDPEAPVDIDKYLVFAPPRPKTFLGPMHQFLISIAAPVGDDQIQATVTSTTPTVSNPLASIVPS